MKLFTDEWKKAVKHLTDPLFPHHTHSDMGASVFIKGERCVSVKHRLRKDRAAVASLGCWKKEDGPDFIEPDIVWFVTTAMPDAEQATTIGNILLAYLEEGQPPSLDLPTYPGYEDLNKPLDS